MSPTARSRRLAGAACLVLGPVLLAVASAVLPWQGGDDGPLEMLDLLGAHVTAVQAADLVAFAGLLAMIPATLAVMRAHGRDAPVPGLVGGGLSMAGVLAAMLGVVMDQIAIGLAEPVTLRPAAAALDPSPARNLNVVLVVFLGGILIGGVVLGAGVLRSRIVPVWAGIAVVASPVAGLVAHLAARKAIDVVGNLLFVAGYAAIARRVLATHDRVWEARAVSGAPAPRDEMAGATP